jgi:hypothetical protein
MVLKNEPIYFEYYANQYTSDCINVDQKMTNTYNHNIFEELLVCYFTVKSKLEQIPSGKINRHLLNVKKIHSKFYSKEFCETFANFIIKNKDNSFIKELSYLENDTYDSLYYDCSNLGNGINSEGYNTAIDYFRNHPDTTALFAMSDAVAIGAVRALQDLGKKVPDDISVVGFDGIDLSRFTIPRLTTVEQPVNEIADRSVNLLLDMVEKKITPRHVLVNAVYRDRDSVAPPKKV